MNWFCLMKHLVVPASVLAIASFCGCTSDSAKTAAYPDGMASSLVLAEKGKTDYQVVVPDTVPTPKIGRSLGECAYLIQAAFKANGAELPAVLESERDPARPGIYLGDTAFARDHGVEATKLKGWSYVLKVVGRDLIVAGRDQQAIPCGEKVVREPLRDRCGTMKGVADFLRQYAGVRFLYPPPWEYSKTQRAQGAPAGKEAFVINSKAQAAQGNQAKLLDYLLAAPYLEFLSTPVVSVPSGLDVLKTPCLEYNTGWFDEGNVYDIANNRFPQVDAMLRSHSHVEAVPVEKYYASHPEYFALVGGKRVSSFSGNPHYCISNPEFQELLYQDICQWFDRGCESVDLMQDDGFVPCECENCNKLYDTGSDWGEKLWILHRNLAERLLKAYPTKKVTIGAYCLTEVPPKTFKAFPENVRIRFTTCVGEEFDLWRGYDIPGGFTVYSDNQCPNLGSRYTPMHAPRFVEAQAKLFFANGVHGVYNDAPDLTFGLSGPVFYIMGRMYDDPEHNQAKDLLNEFCGAAFGKTSGNMLDFYNTLYHGIALYSDYLGTRCPAWTYKDIYGHGRKYLLDPFQMLGFLYTPELLAGLERNLAQAEKAANTDKVKARLELVRKEFEWVKNLARVVHLYHAYKIAPDLASRNRLLDAIDARNALIDGYYSDAKGMEHKLVTWADVYFPPGGNYASHMRLAYDHYQGYFKDTCLNWDTKAMRAAPLGADGTPKKNPTQAWRESYPFEMPLEWKNMANPLPTPLNAWMFRRDPLDLGVKERWFGTDLSETEWSPMTVPSFWDENEAVGEYLGDAWYRITFKVPAEWKGKPLCLFFGSIDEQAWVYVNGVLVREHTIASEGKPVGSLWEDPFVAEVPPDKLKYGDNNVLAVRVNNSAGPGGIWRPVLGCAMEKK